MSQNCIGVVCIRFGEVCCFSRVDARTFLGARCSRACGASGNATHLGVHGAMRLGVRHPPCRAIRRVTRRTTLRSQPLQFQPITLRPAPPAVLRHGPRVLQFMLRHGPHYVPATPAAPKSHPLAAPAESNPSNAAHSLCAAQSEKSARTTSA